MTSTEEKVDAILDAISQAIVDGEKMADNAMNSLENMNTTLEEYKDANLQLGANVFVIHYLNRIKEAVMERDIKKAENIIRFHSYYQHHKGNLDDGRDISLGQAALAVTLDGYVERFFDAE